MRRRAQPLENTPDWPPDHSGQQVIARHLPHNIDGDVPHVISSPFGHDAFLIEDTLVAEQLRRILAS